MNFASLWAKLIHILSKQVVLCLLTIKKYLDKTWLKLSKCFSLHLPWFSKYKFQRIPILWCIVHYTFHHKSCNHVEIVQKKVWPLLIAMTSNPSKNTWDEFTKTSKTGPSMESLISIYIYFFNLPPKLSTVFWVFLSS